MYSALTYDVMKSYFTRVRQYTRVAIYYIGNNGFYVIKEYSEKEYFIKANGFHK